MQDERSEQGSIKEMSQRVERSDIVEKLGGQDRPVVRKKGDAWDGEECDTTQMDAVRLRRGDRRGGTEWAINFVVGRYQYDRVPRAV